MLNTFFAYHENLYSQDNIVLTFFKDMYAYGETRGENYVHKPKFEELCGSIEILYIPKFKLFGMTNDKIEEKLNGDSYPILDINISGVCLFSFRDPLLPKEYTFSNNVNAQDFTQNFSYVTFNTKVFIKLLMKYPDGYLAIRTRHPVSNIITTNIFGEFIGN